MSGASPRWTRLEAGLTAGVAALALFLRFFQYTRAPFFTDNADELDWAWSGMTLILRKVPYGWSYLHAYAAPRLLSANHTTYPVVHPYLDHPPLFSLFVGAFPVLFGARHLADVAVWMIRPPVIVLSGASLVLAHLLGRRVIGPWPSLIGVLLLATAPAAVLMQREVESEALLACWLLAALYLTHRVLSGEDSPLLLALLFLVCLASPLTKVPGIAVAGVVSTLFAAQRRWRLAAGALAAGVAGLGLFAAYGAWQNWQLFLTVWGEQTSRRDGLYAAFQFIAAPAGVNRSIHDGWWLLGWLAIGALASGLGRLGGPLRAERYIAWPVVAYALTMLVMADQRVLAGYGWYRLAVYPLVYLAAGWLVTRLVARPSPAALGLLLALGATAAAGAALGGPAGPWTPSPELVAAALALPLGLSFLALKRGETRLAAQLATAGVVALLVVANVVGDLRLPEVFTSAL